MNADRQHDFSNSAQYGEMWRKMQDGQISQNQWFDYCQSILGKFLETNQDVLTRIKERK